MMRILTIIALCSAILSCTDRGVDSEDGRPGAFTSDAQVFAYLSVVDPFVSYTLFPHADSVVAGTLNGSNAHNPMVRVSLNRRAIGSLSGGRFVSGSSFADSSVVFKEIQENGVTTLYAVMLKERSNGRSGGGWLWGEYRPDGTVVYSIQNNGNACTGCHSLEQGSNHDLVRTFERQIP